MRWSNDLALFANRSGKREHMDRRLLALALLVALNAPSGELRAEPTSTEDSGPKVLRVGAGIHSGDLFAPQLRPDGAWVAYGVREEKKGTFRTSYYAREVNGGLFHAIWPKAHPSFTEGEGTASFTDLTDFAWLPDGRYNAMVVEHKDLQQEVLLQTINVRFTGSKNQSEPAVSPDGSQIAIVSEQEDGNGTELWISDTTDGSAPLQLTFSDASERSPSWHPTKPQIVHELRNRLGGDIYVFDLETFEQRPLVRAGTSDETLPSFAPDGRRFAYLSNADSRDGLRWDLFVREATDTLARPVVRNVRRSERSKGYAWDPSGRHVVAVLDDAEAGYPLVLASVDGTSEPTVLFNTKDNMDPSMIAVGDAVRLTWVAIDEKAPEDRRYRIVYVVDFQPGELGGLAGSADKPPAPGSADG